MGYSQRCFSAACLVALISSVGAQQVNSSQRPPILGPGTGVSMQYDCGSMDATLFPRLGIVKTLCPLAVQGNVFYSDNIRGEELLVALNRDGAVVAIHDRTDNAADTFEGTIDHTGQHDDVIYWGLWRNGNVLTSPGNRRYAVDETRAIPYIAGVSTHVVAVNDRLRLRRLIHGLSDLPTDGVASYTMVGQTGVVSGKDSDGKVVPVGEVQNANAVVDFKNRTVQLDFSVAVRGTKATISLPLKSRDQGMGLNAGAESIGPSCKAALGIGCPQVTAQFYGHDGEFIGILFSYVHHTVLPESAWVAAHLSNVPAQGALVLRKN